MGNINFCCDNTPGPSSLNNAIETQQPALPPSIPYSPLRYSDVNRFPIQPQTTTSQLGPHPQQSNIQDVTMQRVQQSEATARNFDAPHPSYAAPATEYSKLLPTTENVL